MILDELIEEFIEASGRVDLTDAEVTKFLNRGSRLLDRRSLREKIESRAHTALEDGAYIFTTDPDLRSIKSVWAMTATERWQMEVIDLVTMREYYKNSPVDVQPGKPIQYCLTSVTLAAGGPVGRENPSANFFVQWANDLVFDNSDGYRGIVVYPLPEETTVIEVIGNYYTPALTEETPRNWWSMNHPHLLVQAALITLDSNYRNSAGAKELYATIDDDLRQIFYDDIEETLHTNSIMRG